MTRPSAPRLHVTVTDARGRKLTVAGLGPWLATAAPAAAKGTVAIALVSDARMRTLNRTYRGIDRATDVLSFPAEGPRRRDAGSGTRDSGPRTLDSGPWTQDPGPRTLGDLAIARGVAARQAVSHGHTVTTELRILALHGLLHLLGYDHERDGGIMHEVEERLRRRHGLPAGLIARAERRSPSR